MLKFVQWLKTYWPVLILGLLLIVLLDSVLSSLMTCHPISEAGSHATNPKEAEEKCTGLQGPILVSLRWIAHIAHKYEGLVTAVFTIFLAIFTGTLWWSTDKLWRVATETAKIQSEDTKIIQRAYLGVVPRGIHKMNDGTYIAHLAFANTGNLPARNVRNGVQIAWSDNGDKEIFDSVKVSDKDKVVVLPRISVVRGTGSMTPQDQAHYLAEKGFVYVWGCVEYDDGISETRRWTIFCHRYNCTKPDAWRQHHHHNDGN